MVGNKQCWIFLCKAALFLSLLLLAACQPNIPQYRTDIDLSQGQTNWQRFITLSNRNAEQNSPFSASLSIRYKTPDKGYRFDAYFWSNFYSGVPSPVRLDILGAFGVAKAKIFEDNHTFLLYDTESNHAYMTSSSSQAMLQAGIPMPIRLKDLALLFNGHYQDFFLSGQNHDMPELTASNDKLDSVYYIAAGSLKGNLTLNSKGQPITWQDHNLTGWRFELEYIEGVDAFNLPGPNRMRVIHPEGYSVIILIKTLQRQATPFTPEQLDLILPDTASIKQS